MVKQGVKEAGPQGARILVVEDAQQQREALTLQLKNLGHEVVPCADCAQARKAIREGVYACGLIDVNLPDGRGVDMLADFRAFQPNMVFIILTGDDDAETVIEAMRGGAFDYLLKPANLVTLRASVGRALTHHDVVADRDRLTELLRQERDQLKNRVAEATADLRASNAYLDSLLQLAQRCSEFQTEERLLCSIFEQVSRHMPLECVALCDMAQYEFLAAVRNSSESSPAIIQSAAGSNNGFDLQLAKTDPDKLARNWTASHTNLDLKALNLLTFPRSFWDRPVCVVVFLVDGRYSVDAAMSEFLSACSHFIALEWQRARLLLHAAQHASLGTIALELSKGFMKSLTAMRTAADFLSETTLSEEAQEGVDIIASNVDYLSSQTKVFHDLAKPQQGAIETVRVDEYIERTLNLLSMSIRNRDIKINRKFETQSECVLLNGRTLARAFLDLISNAVRTVDAGGAITIRLAEADADRLQCEITRAAARDHHAAEGEGANNERPELTRGHPTFLLAQRTIQGCGGILALDSNNDYDTFRLLLPRNAVRASAI